MSNLSYNLNKMMRLSRSTCLCKTGKRHLFTIENVCGNMQRSTHEHVLSSHSVLFQSRRHCSRSLGSVETTSDNDKGDLALFPNPRQTNMYVPNCNPATEEDIQRLQEFVFNSKKLIVLTGAGISTESGIPDYRSEGVGLYARSTNRPVQYLDFVKYPEIRKRYWARNYVGWPKFGFFLPNSSHKALTIWEQVGKLHWLVTQNVDALHYKAGSRQVTELHGSAHRVMCLGCDLKMPRPEMQELLDAYNTNWSAHSDEMAPDADVQLTPEQIEGFTVPPCPNCGGPLKPEITFFGDNVQRSIVESVYEKVRESDAMLLAGTSLQVYSGYRFAAAANEQGKPIAILNIGPTRADKLATLKINAKCGDVLPHVNLSSL